MNDSFKRELRGIASALDRIAEEPLSSGGNKRLVRGVTPDEPIRSSAEDRLNRTGFATELAEAIIGFGRTESVVIGIHGRWGTGKSSLLNLVEEKLQSVSHDPPIIFRFNPWGFSDQEQVTARFFADLAAFLKLHMSIPPLTGISETVEEYGEMVSPVARMLFPRAAEAMNVGWNWYRKFRPARRKTISELKNHINSGLRESGSKLVIMIDDIDRLNAVEIRQVFQLIKLNANFANTVYVVAFAKGPVERAMKDIAPGPAREYLEKIVQVSFNLPPIPESTLTEIIIANFNDALSELGLTNLDSQRFGNMFQSGFRSTFRTIRDVNRYFNLFRFALNLMYRDTDFTDLAAIEAVSLFYPSVYHSIEANPELFCGGWGSSSGRNTIESSKTAYEKIFSGLAELRRAHALALCENLFPKLATIYGSLNVTYGHEWERSWNRGKRIAAPKYFPYYFQLAVPDTDISQSELDAAFQESTSATAFVGILRRVKESNRFASFIEQLRDNLGSLTTERLLIVLESIFVFGDEVETEGAVLFGLISEYIRFGMWLLFDILDLLQSNSPLSRFQILLNAMRGKPAVFTISDVTAMCNKIVSGESDSAQLKAKYPDLSDEIVSEMKNVTVSAIEQAARDNLLQSAPQLGAVLYRWRQWGDPKHASEWASSTFLESPKKAASLIAAFAQTISSMGTGDRVPKMRITVPIKQIGELVNLDLLANLIQRGTDEELTTKERDAKNRFLSAKAKLDAGQNPDDRFPWDEET